MDTDQKAKHQPGGMMAGGEVWARPSELDETEGERNFCGLQDHSVPPEFLV